MADCIARNLNLDEENIELAKITAVLHDIGRFDPNISLPQYYSYIYEGSPMYQLITEWDKVYSLDGNYEGNQKKCKNYLKGDVNKMNHELKLQSEYYDYIQKGSKRIEIRLFDEKRQKINLGDTITFTKEPYCDEQFTVKVTGLLRYDSFDSLFKDFEISMLADNSMTKEQLKKVLEQFYTPEKQETFGVLGIRIELI